MNMRKTVIGSAGVLAALLGIVASLQLACDRGEKEEPAGKREPIADENPKKNDDPPPVPEDPKDPEDPPEVKPRVYLTGVPAAIDPNSPRGLLALDCGVDVKPVKDVAEALAGKPSEGVLIDATPANLRQLVQLRKKLDAFTAAGGWVMLWGVEPKGLADFNKLVGVEHVLRPFEMEEIEPLIPCDPLAKGVKRGDLFMQTGEMSRGVVPVPIRVRDAWSYVVDYDNIAPFCTLPPPQYWKAEPGEWDDGQPHNPRSMVNGLTDQWRFAFLIRVDRDEPLKWDVKLPREEQVVGFSIHPMLSFCHIKTIRLDFGDGGKGVDIQVQDESKRQDFPFPARKTKAISMEITQWAKIGDKQRTLGIYDLRLKVKRSKGFYKKVKKLLTIGVLMKYPADGPDGAGGILLNQLRVVADEPNLKNYAKKRHIIKALLKNITR